METWKPIKGTLSRYGKSYYVSSEGRVKNAYGRILSFHKHYRGYIMGEVRTNHKERRRQIHRLVAEAFIPNPKNKPQVNHLNGIKSDNRVVNLEWCTNYENSVHARMNGFYPPNKRGEDHQQAHLTNEQALGIRNAKLGNGITRKTLCKEYGVSIHVVKDVRHGKSYNI